MTESWLVILTHVPPALLVIFRVGGLFVYAPIFGSSVIPVRMKVLLSFAIGLAIYPVVGTAHLGGQELQLDLWSLAPLVMMEATVGVAIGYIGSLPFLAAQTGGLLAGQQMGLGFAQIYNPAMDDQAEPVGQLMFFMLLAGFLAIGGHDAIVLAVIRSFDHVPVGVMVVDLNLIDLIAGILLMAFELALRVGAPVLALIFLQSVAMGFVSKTVPQLNILSLGFPLRILGGLLILILGIVVIDAVLMDGATEVLDLLMTWIETPRTST